MVSVPVTSYLSLPVDLTRVLLNVISGYFSTSKKFAERRSLSRPSLAVSMLAVLIVNSTVAASGLAASATTVPAKSLKWPRTRLIRWRIWKPASEWFLSMVQVSAKTGEASSSAARAAEGSLRVIISLLDLRGRRLAVPCSGFVVRNGRVAGVLRAGAELVEQADERRQVGSSERRHEAARAVLHGAVQLFEQSQPRGRDPAQNLPAVARPALAAHQRLRLQPVEQARHARCALHHARGDLERGQPVAARPAQDPKHVVLLERDPVRLDDARERPPHQVGGARQRHHPFLGTRGEGPGLPVLVLDGSGRARHGRPRY